MNILSYDLNIAIGSMDIIDCSRLFQKVNEQYITNNLKPLKCVKYSSTKFYSTVILEFTMYEVYLLS